ncbi:MAG: hypothetical protein ACFB02_04585 [Mastigocoleus sp.]
MVKVEQTVYNLVIVLSTIAVGIFAFHAISQMIFSVITRTPEDPFWGFAVALFISLGISGIILPITYIFNRYLQKSLWEQITISLSTAASGALMGFYYGGIATGGRNAQAAAISACIAAIVISGAGFYLKKGFFSIIPYTIATISAYGFTFILSAKAAAYLSTYNFIPGIILTILSLLSINLTLIHLNRTIQKVLSYKVTSFQGADITDIHFFPSQNTKFPKNRKDRRS